MATPASAAIIAASRDADLHARFVALGATLGKTQTEIEQALPALVSAPIADGSSVAAVYEYADATYQPTPRPGANPAAVTDAHILEAIRAKLDA